MGKFLVLLMMVMMWCWASMAEAEYMLYKDPKQPQSVRINDLMKRMTLEEKIGQMTQIERSVASKEVMKKYFIGSVLSGGGSVPSKQATPETWVDMVNEFQRGALSTRLGIPYIYGIDAVHGHNNQQSFLIMDPILVKKIGAATALEVRATGIQYVFAPCIAVCRDPRWGRCYESYSEDPEIVRLMTEIIPGLQGEITDDSKTGAPFTKTCAKHYLGDGGTHLGTNEGNTILDSKKLFSIHMPAYNDSIIKGVATIMTSYSSWNGAKMHANRNLVTGYLKNKLKFKGFVISDWQGIDRITDPPHANYTYSVLAGINAGIDMFMIPYNYTEFIDGLTYLVENKFVPMSRIDDAVERILRVKFTMGLFENSLADYSMTKYLGSQEHRDLAREAVRKSLVLLKNGKSSTHPLLPLPKRASKILVAGSHANNIGYQCGGWTIEWQGVSGNVTDGTTILSAVEKAVDTNTKVIYNENPNQDFLKSNSFDFAIIVVGEPPYAETFGDNSNLTIAEPGPSTIKNVCGAIKCVVVLVTGRPVVVQPFVGTIDALVAAWLPGTEGQGVTDKCSPMRFNSMVKFTVLLVMVMMWCLASMAEAEYMLYKDPKQPQSLRINDLMKRMTLEEKIGQMTQIERKVASKEIMNKYLIGSVLSGGGSAPSKQATAKTWVDMVNEFQKGALSTRLGIPYIYGIDAVHGHNTVYGATIFPHNSGLGVTRQVQPYDALNLIVVCEQFNRDPILVKKIGAATALEGFVISDWQGIDGITDPAHANYTYSILAGINAGIDMVMVPINYTEFIDGLTYLVKNKFIPMSRIDDAVRRILRVKFTMGLFENPLADYSMIKYLGCQEHRDLAREAVRKSLVLLKNGSHANSVGYQCGGWTVEWQGSSGNVTIGTTILSAVKNTVDPNTQVIYKKNPSQDFLKSNSFDFSIVVVGEPPYTESFGDSSDLKIPEPGPSTIKNVCGLVKCVVVLIAGRPLVVQPFIDTIDAFVAAWLPGTEGQGVTDVLFGDYGFTGKLARTWFKSVDQLPMNVGDPHYDPLYPFGFGLTTAPTKST
ncbi:LOW QUALITY PROTEIN: hypothetical protein M8C21_007983 [Ambrosia artemisiifolia]|uniref:Beta-glucosidase n=1 Tax=Ambrosia artemisiifolia TaxID=4212 RepID=A0AAD5CVX2_AMBAR|nr:LOW QUALITY PROTEIN: hypothetical protein M8C21_007983 [Ambrosia artemisiifolia]